jgi:hypothetical protein
MFPVVENSLETAPPLKPVQAVPAEQVADKYEPRLPKVYDHPQPVSVYDELAICGNRTQADPAQLGHLRPGMTLPDQPYHNQPQVIRVGLPHLCWPPNQQTT